MNKHYDVVIIGGGPVGIALAIELGMHNIKVCILEKHTEPLFSPRAQFLSARSMEFFRRWGLAETLKEKRLLPPSLPIQTIWCAALNETAYASADTNEGLTNRISPEQTMRIPLWITESVLRQKLTTLPTITFLKNYEVIHTELKQNHSIITARYTKNKIETFESKYVIGCDGAKSLTREKISIEFESLATPNRIISVMFSSDELEKLMTINKRGVAFYLLKSKYVGVLGPIDPSKNTWYAQIKDNSTVDHIDQINLPDLLDDLAGFPFRKQITQAHFWYEHTQLAKHFSKENIAFLVGDSAHAFAPRGGFGLNTGLAAAINLAWKLASVIKYKAHRSLLSTYETERRPIALHNLNAAQKNVEDITLLRKKYSPNDDPEAFNKASSALAKQHSQTLGITMGYAYLNSELTSLHAAQSLIPTDPQHYIPTAAPGYFLPHAEINPGQSIYDILSPKNWTLLIANNEEITSIISQWHKQFNKFNVTLETLRIPNTLYSEAYILLRPDWHIAWVGEQLSDEYFSILKKYFTLSA